MLTPLLAPADIAAARALIEACGLRFEAGFDELVGIHDGGELAAVGARAGCVLKMLAVAPAHRGGPLLGEIVSALVAGGLEADCETLFIFTKPPLAASFAALNFTLLASQGPAAWLEFGHGLRHWLAARQPLARPGANGAVVMGGDPLARGFRPLVEAAARQVDQLYVFVPRGGGAPTPFAERLGLARLVTDGLANALVLDAGPYRTTAARFPTYFLPADAPVARIRAELDAALFAAHIAPAFGIVHYFLAEEAPGNERAAVDRILAGHGITVTPPIPTPGENP